MLYQMQHKHFSVVIFMQKYATHVNVINIGKVKKVLKYKIVYSQKIRLNIYVSLEDTDDWKTRRYMCKFYLYFTFVNNECQKVSKAKLNNKTN